MRPGKDEPGHPPSLIRVFTVHMKKAWVLSYPLSAQQRLWSDWADAQSDLSLRWELMLFCWFFHVPAHMSEEPDMTQIKWILFFDRSGLAPCVVLLSWNNLISKPFALTQCFLCVQKLGISFLQSIQLLLQYSWIPDTINPCHAE